MDSHSLCSLMPLDVYYLFVCSCYFLQLLLQYGCSVDGSAALVDNTTETPLQLACVTGRLELVALLLKNNADLQQQTFLKRGLEAKNYFNCFTLAASHGRR